MAEAGASGGMEGDGGIRSRAFCLVGGLISMKKRAEVAVRTIASRVGRGTMTWVVLLLPFVNCKLISFFVCCFRTEKTGPAVVKDGKRERGGVDDTPATFCDYIKRDGWMDGSEETIGIAWMHTGRK